MTKDRPRNRPHGGGGQGQKSRPDRPWGAKKRNGRPGDSRDRGAASFEEAGEVWIWGMHAGAAALANADRAISTVVLTRNALNRLGVELGALPGAVQVVEPGELDVRLPAGAVHQGLALRAAPLGGLTVDEAVFRPDKPLAILDQVTDPQNVGAIFRSAAAFGFGGVVQQDRHAPMLGGALAKAAAGAIEVVPEISVVNIARTIDALTDAGWRVIGLEGTSEFSLGDAVDCPEPVAVVLGAEGAGLRPAVAKACTQLARIPMSGGIESLNVSNAAAIAFYEASRRGSGRVHNG